MHRFFENLPCEHAERVQRLTKLIYELRENRKTLLAAWGVEDEDALLARIRAGDVPEHPAYEHYLGARVLAGSREAFRAELQELLQRGRQP